MKSVCAALAAIVIPAGAALAAELPSLKPQPKPALAQHCMIGDVQGFRLPGSDTCVKITGDVKFETIGASRGTGYAPGITVTRTGP